jgi:Tfp pilus assembly protein PilN
MVVASADLFTVALGLALSSVALEGQGRRISLLPAEIQAERAERQHLIMAGAGVGVLALALVGVGVLKGHQVAAVKSNTAKIEAATLLTEAKIAKLKDVETLEADVASKRQMVITAAQGDIAWPGMVDKVSAAMPAGVWLTSFTGVRSVTLGTPSTVTFVGTATDQGAVADFLRAMAGVSTFDHVWLSSAARPDVSVPVTFTATATLTQAAESGIAAKLGGSK